jgi:hypothetical protein
MFVRPVYLLFHVLVLRLFGGLRPMNETARKDTLPLSKPRAAVGTHRHRREFKRLPVDGAPHRHGAVLVDDLVGAHRVADRNVADDSSPHVPPDRLDVLAFAEPDHGAALEGVPAVGDPRPFDDADDVLEVEGTVGVQQRRTVAQAGEIDVCRIQRQHLVVAFAGPGVPPADGGSRRPHHLDGARLGLSRLRHQSYVAGLHRKLESVPVVDRLLDRGPCRRCAFTHRCPP